MIKYKCASCGAELETDNSLSGKEEACPVCRKINAIPLSKADLAEQQERRKEKAKQERNLRLEAQTKATAAAEERRRQRAAQEQSEPAMPMMPRSPMIGQPPVQASLTESALLFIGGACVAIGLIAFVICVVGSLAAREPGLFLVGLAAVAISFLIAMPYFILQLVLRYLRRIMNAVEERK